MSYTALTTSQRKGYETALVDAVYIDGDHYKYGNFVKGDAHLSSEFNVVSKISDVENWYRIDKPTADKADVDYTPTERWYHGLAKVMSFKDKVLQASKTNGFAGLVQDTNNAILAWMDKQLEGYVIKGPTVQDTRDTSYGLYNEAGNTTTYDTVKFATATGVTKAVEAMVILEEADGFMGPYDLIALNTLKPYIARQVRNATTDRKEISELKEMGIENIYYSDEMPSATEDGSMMLLQKQFKGKPTYVTEYMDNGFGPVGPLVWEPRSYSWVQLVAGHFRMKVYHANAICTHTSVDLA